MEAFDSERDLVEAFSQKSRKFLTDVLHRSVARHFLIEEFDSYIGVADIVLGTYRPYLSKRNPRSSINSNWIQALKTLRKNEIISIDDFKNKFNLSKDEASRRLSEYSKARFISRLSKGNYSVVKEYEYVADTVVAVEAKLKNWKRALFQAQRYKKFSDFSFVLLDKHYSHPAISKLQTFKDLNVGLITMSMNQYKIHYIPLKINSVVDDYYLRLNERAYNYFANEL